MSKKSKKRKQAVQTFAEPAEKLLPRPQLLKEQGISGDVIEDGGLVTDPYNANLDGKEWFDKVDEMRRASASVQAVEAAITLPIADCDWGVEALSDELKDFVTYAVMESASTTWSDTVRRAALSSCYGTWAMETVYREDEDGRLVIRRYADRLPRSITGYLKAPDGGLKAVTQEGMTDDGDQVEVEIPVEKMLIFPYRMEGSNWNGMSTLRAAYGHYYMLRFLTQFSSIGAERGVSGVPYVGLPQNANNEDKAIAKALAKAARRHEAAGFVLPFGYTIDQLTSMSPADLLELMKYHRGEIPRSCLMDIIVLGSESEGSFALAKTKLQVAMMAWNFLAGGIADVFNRHLIPRLMAYNFPNIKAADMPQIVPSRVGLAMLLAEMSDFITTAINGKLIVPDSAGGDENFWRAQLGLPERTDEELAASWAQTAGNGQSAIGNGKGGDKPPPVRAGLVPAPDAKAQKFAAQERTMHFAAADVDRAVQRVAGDMAAAEDAWQRQGRVHLVGWLQSLLSQLDALQGDVTRAGEVYVPLGLVDGYADWIGEWLTAAWEAAAQTMEESIGVATIATAPAARLQAKAAMIAAHHAEAARFEVVMAALRGQTGEAIGAAFSEAMSRRLRGELPVAGREIADQVSVGAGA